ncbi:MAG: arsenate reductase family protein [Eubacteriaceae bacterium]|nr:arsenate reductase family protein [Eubacteriaceae bacterium]
MILFVGYRKCGTCRKAMTWLEARGLEYEFRDIREDNPTEAELREWIPLSGLSPAKFFNTSGGAYRELGVKDRLKNMSDDEMIGLLATDGMLVKRPVLVSDGTVMAGFRQEIWEDKLAAKK